MDNQRCPRSSKTQPQPQPQSHNHLPQANGQQRGPPLGRSPPPPVSPTPQTLPESPSLASLAQTEELFDLIASSQSRRLDDQRASMGDRLAFAIAQNNIRHLCEACNPQQPTDDFFNMLIKYQSCRLNDQRCSLPECVPGASSDPDEAFFSLIQRVQAKRMDEQRVSFYCDQHDQHDPGTSTSSNSHSHHEHNHSSRPDSGSS